MGDESEYRAALSWDQSNPKQPGYCKSDFLFDIGRLTATPETIAALFGVLDPSTISIVEGENDSEMKIYEKTECIATSWHLEHGKRYRIRCTDPMEGIVPIHQIFQLLPGESEAEKDDRLNRLSINFYEKIWHDPDVPEDFRNTFVNRFSSAEIQAHRQYHWFVETFGGPSMYEGNEGGSADKFLLRKTMAKHTSSRMSMKHCITWLTLMKTSCDEEFPSEPTLLRALGIYWLHFFAMFPLVDSDRKKLRSLVEKLFMNDQSRKE